MFAACAFAVGFSLGTMLSALVLAIRIPAPVEGQCQCGGGTEAMRRRRWEEDLWSEVDD